MMDDTMVMLFSSSVVLMLTTLKNHRFFQFTFHVIPTSNRVFYFGVFLLSISVFLVDVTIFYIGVETVFNKQVVVEAIIGSATTSLAG